MNKNAIKSYAIWARKELIDRVKRKAYEYEVTESSTPKSSVDSVNGRLLTNIEKTRLNSLIIELYKHSFNHVIEEVAYTWFNRFIALRFMEVNGFLPQKINVFTNDKNEFKPQILDEAISVELKGLDKQTVIKYVEDNNQDELYKYLLLCLCNDMNDYLPDMFTPIDDYKALLIPDNLLNEGSVLDKLVKDIPLEDWLNTELEDSLDNGTTVIGWMYQYYISERHNEVVNLNKGTIKKEDIPAATELWTTDWVVRYMVDNSLGRYWVERNPKSLLRNKLKYLATSKNNDLPAIEEIVKPEDITFLDPCMGSGHILAYAFDVFMEIYRECGYSDRDAAISILKNNIFGIDIDERAYQLAYFSIMMKARTYNRRILTTGIQPNLVHIIETNDIKTLSYFGMKGTNQSKEMSEYLLSTFKDALELGSLIEVEDRDYKTYASFLKDKASHGDFTNDFYEWESETYPIAKQLIKQAEILSKKYTVTTTNPPYLSKMEGKLKDFVINNYKDVSYDLFAVFIKRNFKFTQKNGYMGFMTPYVWMFIKSYEKLREYIIYNKGIITLIQMEYSAYEEATVPICSFVLSNKISNPGYYYRLTDFKGGMEVQKNKVLEANENEFCNYYYETDSGNYTKIPGFAIAYWLKDTTIFRTNSIANYFESAGRNKTHNNPLYVRLWWEVCDLNRWQPYANGGDYRKWYGNHLDLVDWSNSAKKEYSKHGGLYNQKFAGREGICWNLITSAINGFRIKNDYEHYSSAAPTIIGDTIFMNNYILSFLNSKVSIMLLKMLNPTINTTVGDVLNLPLRIASKDTVDLLVDTNIKTSKIDWDSYETSWDFSGNPIIKQLDSLWDATAVGATIHHYYGKHVEVKSNMELCYHLWKIECNERFKQLKENEEVLNRIFIDVYGLQDELTPEESDKDVTVHYVVDSKNDIPSSFEGSNYVRTKLDEIKSFISYAVGCMFGRYSLDVKGLAYAGGEWNDDKYRSFIPDKDNIIPIYEDEYYGDDDITGRFVEFVKVVFGTEELEANLKFIADTLGGRGTPREVIRNYFINDYFKDHNKLYKKCPIYWLFDSGKKNGFKSLIYIHRYKPDLIARMRTEYIHPQQTRFRTQMSLLEAQLQNADKASQIKINKQIKSIKEKANELAIYEEKIHHWADKMEPMDLDDGVKANYAKFQELLTKI